MADAPASRFLAVSWLLNLSGFTGHIRRPESCQHASPRTVIRTWRLTMLLMLDG